MIDLSKYRPSVKIQLENGVYVFPHSSVDGKTYLCSLLYSLRNRERVDSHTYPADFRPADLFDSSRRDLVMLDRYDMYAGQGLDEIIKFSKTGIVLIDCKSYRFPMTVKSCRIRFRKNELVVL